MNEETEVYIKWLRSIADRIEERGIEEGSAQSLNIVGTTEVTRPDDEVRNYKATKDQFFVFAWRYET